MRDQTAPAPPSTSADSEAIRRALADLREAEHDLAGFDAAVAAGLDVDGVADNLAISRVGDAEAALVDAIARLSPDGPPRPVGVRIDGVIYLVHPDRDSPAAPLQLLMVDEARIADVADVQA